MTPASPLKCLQVQLPFWPMHATFLTASMRSIDLPPEVLRRVQSILLVFVGDRPVRAFGSRAMGQAKPMSDLDLCIMGESPVPPSDLAALRGTFTESDIPMRVDIVEWSALP